MAKGIAPDLSLAELLIRNFSLSDLAGAARFHGDIGENAERLERQAAGEQALVQSEDEKTLHELRTVGEEYCACTGIRCSWVNG